MSLDRAAAMRFIREQTVIAAPPLVPEIRLHLATEITPIWQATEESLALAQVPPPFWAFAWAGGQALARYVLDHPEAVRGRRVLDFGSGSGLVAIAAALAGASTVTAAEVDGIACAAIALNAELNGVHVAPVLADLIGSDPGADIILAGDVCYEGPAASRLTLWLRGLAASGTAILLADPGRTYCPKDGLDRIASYDVPTSLELEDKPMRKSFVARVLAG